MPRASEQASWAPRCVTLLQRESLDLDERLCQRDGECNRPGVRFRFSRHICGSLLNNTVRYCVNGNRERVEKMLCPAQLLRQPLLPIRSKQANILDCRRSLPDNSWNAAMVPSAWTL